MSRASVVTGGTAPPCAGPNARDLAAQLVEQPRAAVDGAMAVQARAQRGVGSVPADQGDGAPRGQRLRAQGDGAARAGEQAQQVRGGARVVAACADRDQHLQLVDPAGEVGEGFERLAVGPLRVVDDQRERLHRRQRRAEPEQAVRELGAVVAGRRAAAVQQPHGVGRRAFLQADALVRGDLAQRCLEQRADHAVGEVALQRAGCGASELEVGVLGEVARVVEQDGLAEPGRRLEHDDRAAAAGDAGDGVGQRLELGRALEQRARDGGVGRKRGCVAGGPHDADSIAAATCSNDTDARRATSRTASAEGASKIRKQVSSSGT